MRITFLVRAFNYGGAQRQLVELARGLHGRGHRVLVVVFYSGGPMERDLHTAGVPVLALGKRGRWDLPGFLLRLARCLRRERPQIVHGYLGIPNILALLTKPFYRGSVVWGVRSSSIDLKRYDWLARLDAYVERWLSRFPDLIISNSHAGRADAVAQGFPEHKVIVVPNGIDMVRFHPDPAAGQRIRAQLGIAQDTKLIGRSGRLDPQKDYPTFLRAAAVLAQERDDVRFVCVGDGPADYARTLHELSTSLGLSEKLIWTGGRDDMPAVYNALDVAVSSSAYGEGTPNVVAEAMACGVPCVVTDVGDSAWVVGETGDVIPPGDPIALSAAVSRMLDRTSRCEISREAVRACVVANFSLTGFLEQTESALARVLEGGASA